MLSNKGGVPQLEPLEARFLLSGTIATNAIVGGIGLLRHTSSHLSRRHRDPASPLTVGGNVNTTSMSGNQLEAKIAINPTNPQNMVTASLDGNGGDILVMTSFDGGNSWSTQKLDTNIDGLAAAREDPHVVFDRFGNVFIDYIAAQRLETDVILARSADGGQSFSALRVVHYRGFRADSPNLAVGPDANNPSLDAVWMTYTNQADGQIYAVGINTSGQARMGRFARATPVSGHPGSYSSVAVGPSGEVSVAWESPQFGAGPAMIFVSTNTHGLGGSFGSDQGATRTNVGGFDFIPAQPDASIDAEPGLAYDRSGGPANGRLYLVYTEASRPGGSNTGIMLRYSDNQGATWSRSLQVNDGGNNNSALLPAIAVDQTSGNVGISWYDARNVRSNDGVQLFATVSTDHGGSVLPNVQVSAGTSFQARANGHSLSDLDLGDYTGLAYQSGKLVPVWADNSNSTGDNPDGASTFDVYTAVVGGV